MVDTHNNKKGRFHIKRNYEVLRIFCIYCFYISKPKNISFLKKTDLPYHCSKKLENSRMASAVVFNLFRYVAQMTLGKNWVTHSLVCLCYDFMCIKTHIILKERFIPVCNQKFKSLGFL